jgi:saccharopine dehydrogenase-like NADP-dependent oxidoreductase
MTALPAVRVVLLLGCGGFSRRGVMAAEALDPRWFFSELAGHGVEVTHTTTAVRRLP